MDWDGVANSSTIRVHISWNYAFSADSSIRLGVVIIVQR